MSNAILAWSILALCVLISFILGQLMAFKGYGTDGFAPWFLELHVMYFWFSLIFLLIAGLYKNYAQKHDFLRGKQYFMGWLFTLYVAAVMVLRFAFEVDVMLAYGLPILFCIIIPFNSFFIRHSIITERLEKNKIAPDWLYKIVIESSRALSFLQCFPDAKAYAFQLEQKHSDAKCIFVHRRKRDERPEMYEDIVLEVTVNTNTNPPQIAQEECSRYLFHDGEEGSAVIHLYPVNEIKIETFNQPLEYITLTQFDSAFERYPLLGHLPLALAAWRDSYVEMN